MNTITIIPKSLVGGLLAGFFVFSLFIPAFQAQAAFGTGCGDATGSGASVALLVLTDSTKNWRPDPNRWVGGTLTITGSSVPGDIGKSGSVSASTARTITVAAWVIPAGAPAGPPTGTLSYRVTADVAACVVGAGPAAKNYSCLQVGDAGFCKGPCSAAGAPGQCNRFVGAGDLTVGWAGAKCTGTPAVVGPQAVPAVDGVCLEAPRSASSLPGTEPAATGEELLAIIDTVTNWIFAIFVVLSIIFVLLAAFQFVTAGGQAEKVGEARQKLIWAAVGIIIALLAKGLVPIVRNIIGG